MFRYLLLNRIAAAQDSDATEFNRITIAGYQALLVSACYLFFMRGCWFTFMAAYARKKLKW